jgi:hypothetical protein
MNSLLNAFYVKDKPGNKPLISDPERPLFDLRVSVAAFSVAEHPK